MNKRILIILVCLVSVLPILIWREYTPSNELRYLNITDSAIEEGHLFAFYDHSIPYADKPPLYFWGIMLLKKIFGEHYMILLSLLSIIPAFIIIIILDKWVNSRLTDNMRVAAMLMLFTSFVFLGSSLVLRMDMLMCMFITLSLWEFNKLYKNKTGSRDLKNGIKNNAAKSFRKSNILLPIYVFLAIFSKGAIGFLVPVVSIIVFLISEKELRIGKYLGKYFWSILLTLFGLWVLFVYIDGGKEYINNLFLHQTVGRAVNSFHHKKPIWYYAVNYWYIAAPWSILTFVVIAKGFIKRLIWGIEIKLFASIVITTFVMLSIISSKIAIYILPLIPFAIYLTSCLISYFPNSKVIKFSIRIISFIYILIFITSFFIKIIARNIDRDIEIPDLWLPIWVIGLILALGGIVANRYINKNKIEKSISTLSISLLLVIFLCGFSMPTINKSFSIKDGCRTAAEIAKKKGKKIYYYDFSAGPNLDYYLNKENLHILPLSNHKELKEVKSGIVFFKARRVKRDNTLKDFIKDKEITRGGDNINFVEI